jgi:hypothetical protein
MNAETQRYATEIVNSLNAIPSNAGPGSGNAAWSRQVMDGIGKIGEGHNFKVCSSSRPRESFEAGWLYDLIWYRNNCHNRLERVELVLESELSMDDFDLRYDFEKLSVANSPVKVMVFQNYVDTMKTVFKNMENGINEYVFGVSCVYILACYCWNTSGFQIRQLNKEPGMAAEPSNQHVA